MQTFSRFRRYIAWLALCAMCFGAVAPSISKWLASTQDIAWVDVCSEAGPEHVAISTAPEKAPKAPAMGDDYCAYCALVHHLPFVPPTAVAFTPQATAYVPVHPAARVEPPVARPERHAHAPRAPPALA
jgi:hypothetical protein